MKFAASTVALVLTALAMAHPEPISSQGEGLVHNIDTRALTANEGNSIFGRAINCPSNNPRTCCACRGGAGFCFNGRCSCQGGDC
ncbi:hypothetical protein V8F33_002225 [Rhypophila sp. PSN 637]